MKKIFLIDYIGISDQYGNAVGHSAKVFGEYAEILREEYAIEGIIPLCIKKQIEEGSKGKYRMLRYCIKSDEKYRISTRIFDKFKEIYNIRQVFLMSKNEPEGILWFYRLDFFLFLYLFIFGADHRKIVCLMFQENFSVGIMDNLLNYIYNKALRKVSAVIYTSRQFNFGNKNACYMPDYYYDELKYKKYQNILKEKKVVCLGTMGYQKQLEETVSVFNELKMPLEIAGRFYEEERYKKLKKMANANVSVRNELLSNEEYYKILAGAQYAILPYDIKLYNARTSGVLLECLFVGTVPIAPYALLETNTIPGIGYHTLDELRSGGFMEQYKKICPAMKETLDKEYNKEKIAEGLRTFFREIQS